MNADCVKYTLIIFNLFCVWNGFSITKMADTKYIANRLQNKFQEQFRKKINSASIFVWNIKYQRTNLKPWEAY